MGKAYHKCCTKYVCPYVKNIYQATLRKTFVIEIRNAKYCYTDSPISSVQLLSRVRLFATPWTATWKGFLVHHQLPELAQTHVHSSRWCHSTISSSVVPFSFPSIFPSIMVFSNESVLHKVLDQSTGASASASTSVLPIKIQDWFPLGLTYIKPQ